VSVARATWQSSCTAKNGNTEAGLAGEGGQLNKHRSWLALITLCVTPALIVALGLAILFAGAAVAFAASNDPRPAAAQEADKPRERVFAGLITDEHCGARHDMDSGMNPTECTKMCVRTGSKYVLVVGEKRYALVGGENQFDDLAGQRANVAGILDGNTIKVSSVSSVQ
jgi:hypothetical protein